MRRIYKNNVSKVVIMYFVNYTVASQWWGLLLLSELWAMLFFFLLNHGILFIRLINIQ